MVPSCINVIFLLSLLENERQKKSQVTGFKLNQGRNVSIVLNKPENKETHRKVRIQARHANLLPEAPLSVVDTSVLERDLKHLALGLHPLSSFNVKSVGPPPPPCSSALPNSLSLLVLPATLYKIPYMKSFIKFHCL